MSTEQIRIETIRELGASMHSAIEGLPLANAKRLAAALWDATARVTGECEGLVPDEVLHAELVDCIRFDLPTITRAAAEALAPPLARKLSKAQRGLSIAAAPAPAKPKTEKSEDADLRTVDGVPPDKDLSAKVSSFGHADE